MQYDPGKNRGVLISVILKVGKCSQKGHKPFGIKLTFNFVLAPFFLRKLND